VQVRRVDKAANDDGTGQCAGVASGTANCNGIKAAALLVRQCGYPRGSAMNQVPNIATTGDRTPARSLKVKGVDSISVMPLVSKIKKIGIWAKRDDLLLRHLGCESPPPVASMASQSLYHR
jgi:hypothetical protein